ncbi:MAG: cytochrome c [Gemmatimonadota bacterium]|nr:cytochrome c [Gemmatimonadota bacterium]MDH3421609.1 cytochrome c [Gemmatimonadota bacterium]
MTTRSDACTHLPRALTIALGAAALVLLPGTVAAQGHSAGEVHQPHVFASADFGIDPTAVTFTRDIAPILERSCIGCHRAGGAAPMSFTTYQEVRRYASRIRDKTAIRDRMGAMPPWYVEKDIGIQEYKQDPSLSDEELATIQAWVANGAPEGNPADLTAELNPADVEGWRIRPDLVVSSDEILMEGGAPDWWGEITPIDIPLTQDRYVKSVEIREINDVPSTGTGRQTVGGRWMYHHLIYRTQVDGESVLEATGWPVHEVGRNPDLFSEESGRLLKAGSQIVSESVHLHSTGIDTRGRLEFGFEFFPEDYEPEYANARIGLGDGLNISIAPNRDGQELHAYHVLEDHVKIIAFEPHLHAPGDRMCLEAIWKQHIETLSCVGYDHNWVRTYSFAENYEPLLPKGAVMHITGYMNNTEANFNIPDTRNWQGSGNRSVANMFIDLGIQLRLTDEQFVAEMAHRREVFDLDANDHVIGCPLCMAEIPLLPEMEEEPPTSDVEASAAAELLGTWALPLVTPQGTFNLSLEFWEGDDGQLAASVSTSSSSPQSVQTISRSGEDLVLGLTLSALGQSTPATITLTPEADGADVMAAEVDLDGAFTLSGTATKEG